MKEHSVIYNSEMVRADLEGRKNMTRKPIKHFGNSFHINKLLCHWGCSEPPKQYHDGDRLWHWIGHKPPKEGDWIWELQSEVDDTITAPISNPYGQPGDVLWVRETWAPLAVEYDYESGYCEGLHNVEPNIVLNYRKANPNYVSHAYAPYAIAYKTGGEWDECAEDRGFKWKSPRFMPRWACRTTHPITKIKVERLQEITEEDAVKEGLKLLQGGILSEFHILWNDLYTKKPEYQWEVNPWVWVIEYDNHNRSTTARV